MFDQIVAAIAEYPYLGVVLVFLLCGIGLPLPEEIGLLAAGYVCAKFPEHATLPWMMFWCAAAILTGDLIPFVLGRVFGVRLLRLRWLRLFVTKQRLAVFDRWFRRRGDLVIVIARFLAGLRVVAFFTAGTMKMPWRRFLLLDGLGIAILVPTLTWIGFHSAGVIEQAIATVQKVERGILWASLAGIGVLGLGFWLWRRPRRKSAAARPAEAFGAPQRPVLEPADGQVTPLAPPPAVATTDAPLPGDPPPGEQPPGEGPPDEPPPAPPDRPAPPDEAR